MCVCECEFLIFSQLEWTSIKTQEKNELLMNFWWMIKNVTICILWKICAYWKLFCFGATKKPTQHKEKIKSIKEILCKGKKQSPKSIKSWCHHHYHFVFSKNKFIYLIERESGILWRIKETRYEIVKKNYYTWGVEKNMLNMSWN